MGGQLKYKEIKKGAISPKAGKLPSKHASHLLSENAHIFKSGKWMFGTVKTERKNTEQILMKFSKC